jgi:hypothetical protein
MQTEKTRITLSSGQIFKKNRRKKTHWIGFKKRNSGFFQPCLLVAANENLLDEVQIDEAVEDDGMRDLQEVQQDGKAALHGAD